MAYQQPQPAILALGTAVPPHRVDQAALCEWIAESLGGQPALNRWLRHLYRASGIERRYSCLPDAELSPHESRFAPGRAPADAPTTAERMAIYEREAVVVGVAAAQRALGRFAEAAGAPVAAVAQAVTHLIVVSCTGFFAPGLDLALAQRLGLSPAVRRTLVGFMGCAAAFNALRLADQIVRSEPAARVLVVCTELCSIHTQPGADRVNLTVSSLFADGAAACLVGAGYAAPGDCLALGGFHSLLLPDSESDMAWRIGDHGFVMQLSPQIPRLVGQVAPQALAALLGRRARPQFWAVHPGGRSIVDKVEAALELTPDQIAPSRAVLRQYGNMSSPTILFVLEALWGQLRGAGAAVQDGVAMAFGPGVVTEMLHLTYLPAPALARRPEVAHGALA